MFTSTFIKRTATEKWEFAHTSFQEFFHARKFFRWELTPGGKGLFPVVYIPVWQFIAQMSIRNWDERKASYWIEPTIDRSGDPTLTATTLRAAAAYRLLKGESSTSLQSLPLKGIMLDYVDLTSVRLVGCDLSNSDLRGSDLGRADLSNCDLSGSVFVGAQFRETNLQGAMLHSCDISFADFRGARFGNPGSRSHANIIGQLKNCPGRESAKFDPDISSSISAT